ncbi:MAG TPA: 30S ribosomal protein S20 [Candidatus Dormibacteraeota bacterium]|nr:30S ribosomal protein S20 [Candidatus Dormibacteraeota bacterium]
MAKRTASARKQARAGARRAIRNRGARSEVKTLIVKARRSLTDTQAEASERTDSTVEAVRALDRAAAKKILHPNNAARRKSRLARQLAKLAAAAPAPPPKGKKAAPAPAPKKK